MAHDLSAERKALIHTTQTPPCTSLPAAKAGNPAWKDKPSWYIVANDDKAVPPDLQRDLAQRMGATTVAVASSHFPMISYSQEVLEVIREATR